MPLLTRSHLDRILENFESFAGLKQNRGRSQSTFSVNARAPELRYGVMSDKLQFVESLKESL